MRPSKLRWQKRRQQQQPQLLPNILKLTPADQKIITAIADTMETGRHYVREGLLGKEHLALFGGPGSGKSFLIESTVRDETKNDEMLWKLDCMSHPRRTLLDPEGNPVFHPRWHIHPTHITPTRLFAYAYEYSGGGLTPLDRELLVLDDALRFPMADTMLRLILSMADTRKIRTIAWESPYGIRPLPWRDDAPPIRFQYQGALIIVGNFVFDQLPAPMRDRFIGVQIPISTPHERHLWLQHVVFDQKMLAGQGFEQAEIADVMCYIANVVMPDPQRAATLSLRTAIKHAQLRRSRPHDWMARAATVKV
jgi:hypothetical protein